MWPDFDEADLETALNEFNRRERRFGAVPSDRGKPHGANVDISQLDLLPETNYSGDIHANA
jgi:hypothetical protein